MEETIYYEDSYVVVSNNRLIINDSEYPMINISNAEVRRPDHMVDYIVLGVGFLIFIINFARITPADPFGSMWYILLGIVIFIVGVSLFSSSKHRLIIIFNSIEVEILQSTSIEYKKEIASNISRVIRKRI